MDFHISQRSVGALKPPTKGTHGKVFYDDKAAGFGVRVSEAGIKAFILNYSIAGRERRFTIGRWPEWSADAAREEAGRLRVEINKGSDPLRQRDVARAEPTLTDLSDKYIEVHALTHKRGKSVYDDRRMLEKIVLPKLGKLRVSAVDRIDIQRLHASLKGTPFQANRVLSLLSKMFTCAIDWKMRSDNPVRGILRFAEDKREVWLSQEQLQALALALDAYPEQDAADALRLLILTGSREGEVLGAKWSMFDLQRGIWTKPSHHTKQKKIEHPPLSEGALLVLRRMAEHKTGVYLFPGREGDRSRTTLRNTWRQVCKAGGLATQYSVMGRRGKPLERWRPNVRVNDLRHSFASHLVSRGASLYVVGKLLGHTQATTTQRYAHVADGAQRSATNEFGNVVSLTTAKQSKKGKKGKMKNALVLSA